MRDIQFERRGHAGIVTLDREAALNAVTGAMIDALAERLDEWQDDAQVEHVVIRARGKAFSVGGDIRDLYARRDDPDLGFFAREYRLNHRIHTYAKPYVALVHGLVMGGGVGVSLHGSHVVAGQGMAFAMPECGIGFFPDVGATHLLPRLPGTLGMELGLTGRRLDADECVGAGIVGYRADDLDAVLDRLCEMGADEALVPFGASAPVPASHEAFGAGAVETMLARLGDDPRAGMLAAKSPTSLRIAHRQLSEGERLDFADAMRLEYRIVARILHGHDFYEGIRAQVIDKDREPRWRPPTLAAVDAAEIDRHFDPVDAELRL